MKNNKNCHKKFLIPLVIFFLLENNAFAAINLDTLKCTINDTVTSSKDIVGDVWYFSLNTELKSIKLIGVSSKLSGNSLSNENDVANLPGAVISEVAISVPFEKTKLQISRISGQFVVMTNTEFPMFTGQCEKLENVTKKF